MKSSKQKIYSQLKEPKLFERNNLVVMICMIFVVFFHSCSLRFLLLFNNYSFLVTFHKVGFSCLVDTSVTKFLVTQQKKRCGNESRCFQQGEPALLKFKFHNFSIILRQPSISCKTGSPTENSVTRYRPFFTALLIRGTKSDFMTCYQQKKCSHLKRSALF